MIRNFLRISLRQASRNPFYFFLNLIGLTLGVGCCFLITLYVGYELSFDQFHAKKDRVYRINYDVTMAGSQIVSPSVPVFVGPHIKTAFPEVEDGVRFMAAWSDRTLRAGERIFDERGFAWADSNFFRVFDFKAVQGNLDHALSRPGTLVITRSMAKKYFGEEDPIGKIINSNNSRDYEVTAVMEDVPPNATFRFDFLTSLYSIKDLDEREVWNNPNYATFLLLQPTASPAELSKKIEAWVNPPGHVDSRGNGNSLHLPLEPLADMHFNTGVFNFGGQLAITDFSYLIIFGAIAVLILAIACINYINLATSRAATRAREVGMRKTVGATFRQLVGQFLAESSMMALPAIILAGLAVSALLPAINDITGKQITLHWDVSLVLAGVGVWIVISLLAGFYPALVLARFKPSAVLKGNFAKGPSGWALRKGLVVFQFVISMVLISGTVIILNQLNFLQSKKLGFDKEHVFIIQGNSDLVANIKTFSQQLRSIPGVDDAAPTWRSPFLTVIGNGLALTGNPIDGTQWVSVGGIGADEHYLPTMGIPLVAGRNFDPAKVNDKGVENEFIVNEHFLEQYNVPLDQAIGKKITLGMVASNGPGTIVGVMKDFHTASLHSPVGPIVLFNDPSYTSSVLVRARGEQMQTVLQEAGKAWKTLMPWRPFNFRFLDDEYDALYKTETRMGALITTFSIIAIVIACFGLLGLSSFTAIQRAREIGIRKVMGATSQSVVILLSRGYLKLLALATVIAVPVGYYLMNLWLRNFAYHITVSPLHFVAAAALVAAIAWLTVGYHSVQASLANPADTLKHE